MAGARPVAAAPECPLGAPQEFSLADLGRACLIRVRVGIRDR